MYPINYRWKCCTKWFFVCTEVHNHLRNHHNVINISIRRTKTGLGPEIQLLGNNYVRDEFKRHKKCNPSEAQLFLTEWANYALNLSQQLKPKKAASGNSSASSTVKPKAATVVGQNLPEEKLNCLSDEQIVQLYELMRAAKGEQTWYFRNYQWHSILLKHFTRDK